MSDILIWNVYSPLKHNRPILSSCGFSKIIKYIFVLKFKLSTSMISYY